VWGGYLHPHISETLATQVGGGGWGGTFAIDKPLTGFEGRFLRFEEPHIMSTNQECDRCGRSTTVAAARAVEICVVVGTGGTSAQDEFSREPAAIKGAIVNKYTIIDPT